MKRVLLKAYVFPEEKEAIDRLARQANVTTSELVRRLSTGAKLPNTHLHQAVRDLIKINADLARMGNLFKMALDDPDFIPPGYVNMGKLIGDIRATQETLKEKIMQL